MIHVCFCMTDETGRYSKFVGTSMHSIFENTSSPVTVHILHDNTLTANNREKFSYLAGRYSQAVKFHNVGEMYADKISEMKNFFPTVDQTRFTVGMFYRFFILAVLPENVEKAIYLDGDIIVNLDIKELWEVELGDSPLGVVSEAIMRALVHGKSLYQEDHVNEEDFFGSDALLTNLKTRKPICLEGYVKPEDYFNSGVLLMNLKILRDEEKFLMDGLKFVSENPRLGICLDQNALNYCFAERALKLPIKFNRMTHLDRKQETVAGKKIYHYATPRGLGLNQDDILNRLWMRHFLQTPWFDEDSIGRLYTSLLETNNELKNSALKLSALVSGKTRGFCAEPDQIDEIKKLFGARDDEVIIPVENKDSVKNLIATMRRLKGKVIFFIMTEIFPFEALSKRGFVEGEDFVKGWKYLDPPLKAHSLINAL